MNEYKTPEVVLTVIIRNPGPMVFLQDPPSHRSVHIRLTPEQLGELVLYKVGTNCGRDVWEEIGSAFLEPEVS